MRLDKRISCIPPLHSVRLQGEYSGATTFENMIATRFMSNLYLAVEKVTESLLETFKVKMSFGLAANDKRREGVACH